MRTNIYRQHSRAQPRVPYESSCFSSTTNENITKILKYISFGTYPSNKTLKHHILTYIIHKIFSIQSISNCISPSTAQHKKSSQLLSGQAGRLASVSPAHPPRAHALASRRRTLRLGFLHVRENMKERGWERNEQRDIR